MYQCLAVNEDEESQAAAQLVLGNIKVIVYKTYCTSVHNLGLVPLHCLAVNQDEESQAAGQLVLGNINHALLYYVLGIYDVQVYIQMSIAIKH